MESFIRASGIRPAWMYAAAVAAQALVGRITFPQRGSPTDVRAHFAKVVPTPRSDIECWILDGLIARAEHEARRVLAQKDPADSQTVAIRAEHLLRERFAERWTVRRLARELGTNRFKLTHEFKGGFGVGLHRFLICIRLQEAEKRMRASEDKLETIALDVGFGSRRTFYEAYKRVNGRSFDLLRIRSI